MSLIKSIVNVLTGRFDIERVAEYAKSTNNPVKVSFNAWWEPDLTGCELVYVQVVYQVGKKRFVNEQPIGRTALMNCSALENVCQQSIKKLKDKEKANLEYLSRQGIEYSILEPSATHQH